MVTKEPPVISICVPVFNCEKTLLCCLESVAGQEFTDWELLVVNDGSPGLDEQERNCKKIVKAFAKVHKYKKGKVVYLEHNSNLGLLEARRTLVQSAHGKYITMLDSDDTLLPGALQVLYNTAINSNADIVHGGAETICTQNDNSLIDPAVIEKTERRKQQMKIIANHIYEGELNSKNIFDGFLVQKNHIGFLWGKLFERDLYLQALSNIPFTRCVFSEDFLQYFLISFYAKKYVGLSKAVYCYSVDCGISAFKKITTLEKWEQVCSAANVFTILFSVIKELPRNSVSLQQKEALGQKSFTCLVNNIRQMRAEVSPDLQPAARQMLCEYWGQEFVETVEKQLGEN